MKTAMWNQESILLSAIFPLTSVAGLAQLLRSGRPITKREVASVTLNSGLFGVSVAALLIHKFGVELWPLIVGISLLSGLGGNAMIDLALAALKRIVRDKIGTDEEDS